MSLWWVGAWVLGGWVNDVVFAMQAQRRITHQQTPIADALKRSKRVRTVSAALILLLRYETWFLAGKLLCDDAEALTGALLWDDALVLRFAAGVLLRLDGSRRFAPMPRDDAEAPPALSVANLTTASRILCRCGCLAQG